MQSLLLEASKSTQGNILVRCPTQIFVDESTHSISVRLDADFSKKTENWTAKEMQQRSLVVNYVELHRASDSVLNGNGSGRSQLIDFVDMNCRCPHSAFCSTN